ncbi:MAG: 4Fe-4S binding protein [Salibacteraceae bacterium]
MSSITTNYGKIVGLILSLGGLLILLLAWAGISLGPVFLWLTIGGLLSGMILYGASAYAGEPVGIKNNGVWFDSLSNRGVLAVIAGIVLTGFYVQLYWFPQSIGLGADGGANTGLVALFDPLSMFFKGQPASQWFVYGTLYTLSIIGLGIKFIYKYRHNRYQVIRTISVIIAQLFLAYLIPEILEGFTDPGHYFAKDIKNVWPLNYYFFNGWHIDNMVEHGGNLGMFFFVFGLILFLIITPIVTYYVGKRWYCSWVCGCGGLAETAGDSFRQLSSKSVSSWKLERWMIHSVMVLVFIMTAVTLYGYFAGTGSFFGLDIYTYFQKPYGFLIGSMFSGVIGVGFYPMLGNRVWCRFGCPMAGYMGIIQRFKSRFRITTNGGQCISCGNCSTYCEQGIDVRWYAQRGQNIVRSSCVGCGVCSAVCPRGVLKLENGPEEGRINENPIIIGNDGISIKN